MRTCLILEFSFFRGCFLSDGFLHRVERGFTVVKPGEPLTKRLALGSQFPMFGSQPSLFLLRSIESQQMAEPKY